MSMVNTRRTPETLANLDVDDAARRDAPSPHRPCARTGSGVERRDSWSTALRADGTPR